CKSGSAPLRTQFTRPAARRRIGVPKILIKSWRREQPDPLNVSVHAQAVDSTLPESIIPPCPLRVVPWNPVRGQPCVWRDLVKLPRGIQNRAPGIAPVPDVAQPRCRARAARRRHGLFKEQAPGGHLPLVV